MKTDQYYARDDTRNHNKKNEATRYRIDIYIYLLFETIWGVEQYKSYFQGGGTQKHRKQNKTKALS
jgi:hypothetical protein